MNTTQKINFAVINKAGKVGKSTISKHLIAPMLNADWIQVETFNDSGQGAKAKVAGRMFEFVAEAVFGATRSLCIDIGNSNYQAAMKELQELDRFADRIHGWVVPCTQSAGVMNDSLSTVMDLIEKLGVDPRRIVVLPNDIEIPEEAPANFRKLALAAEKFGFHFCEVVVPQYRRFDAFNLDKRPVTEIAADDFDFDAAIAAEIDIDKRHSLTQAACLSSRSRTIAGRMREVWFGSPLASLAAART